MRRMAFEKCPMCDGYGCPFCSGEEKHLTIYQQQALQAALRRSATLVSKGRLREPDTE